MSQIVEFILKFDEKLQLMADQYGVWTYALLFLIVFCETGLVVTPFLPGDSLLFAVGAFAARPGSALELWSITGLLIVAAILGDAVNYQLGRWLGPVALSGKWTRWLNPKHLEQTQSFFDRYGAKTIVLARFVPIVRTLAPFVAGVGAMNYGKFFFYNVIGAVAWVLICVQAGYWFGSIPWVKERFELVVIGIILVSLAPAVFEFLRHRALARAAAAK